MTWGNANTSIASNKSSGSSNTLYLKNIIINNSDFISYTPTAGSEEAKLYSIGYIYRAAVPIQDCLSVMTSEATLSLPDVESAGVSIANPV